MTHYEKYCAQMRERGLEPTMNEPQLLEAWGIKQKDEPIMLVSRKGRGHRGIEPTLLNHENKPKWNPIKVNLLDMPKKPKAVSTPQIRQSQRKKPIMTDKEKKEQKKARQRGYYEKKVGREVKRRSAPMDLSHLITEEKRKHRLKQQKEYRDRRKAKGIKEVRSAKQKAQRNEYFKHYYERKKNDPQYMEKRAKLTAKYREKISV